MIHPDDANQLKAYVLGELTPPERRAVEERLRLSPEMRLEFERLQLVETAMHSLIDEEPPRRIAFVSDKVLAPPWWRRFWQSGPRWALRRHRC